MPVIETPLDPKTADDDALLTELVAELRQPKPTGQPLIDIRSMQRGGLRHVHVIWDRWHDCPPERRAEIIRDAFAAVKGPDYEQSIAITVAATIPEAAAAGLLPYEVKPRKWYQLKGAELERVRRAMAEEGGSVLDRSFLPALRFADEVRAEEAADRLKDRVPELGWGVIITVLSPDGGPTP